MGTATFPSRLPSMTANCGLCEFLDENFDYRLAVEPEVDALGGKSASGNSAMSAPEQVQLGTVSYQHQDQQDQPRRRNSVRHYRIPEPLVADNVPFWRQVNSSTSGNGGHVSTPADAVALATSDS